MQILKAGVLYFAVVFGAGLVLGPIRILWVVSFLGARMAELLEAPIMLVITIVAARWIVGRLAVPPTPSSRLGMGGIALSLLLNRGICSCALASRNLDRRVPCSPRPCSGNSLLFDAWGLCRHAASSGAKMTWLAGMWLHSILISSRLPGHEYLRT